MSMGKFPSLSSLKGLLIVDLVTSDRWRFIFFQLLGDDIYTRLASPWRYGGWQMANPLFKNLWRKFGQAPYFVRNDEVPLWLMGGEELCCSFIISCSPIGIVENVVGKMIYF